jgi:glycerol-3-phosphate dehydrogenase
MIPKTDDGRVLFAIPWYGKVVVGTTDTPLDKITLEPKALEEEIDFILKTAGKYLTKPPAREDVLCIFAGLRPLAANPENPAATKEVSRRHKITLFQSGLLSITGGKWTSYRRMAEETIDRAIKSGILEPRKCNTKNFNFYIPSGNLRTERFRIYGSRASEIENMIIKQPALGKLTDKDLPYTIAEIIWICRNEMPVTLEDVLARRTRALLLDVRASLRIAPVAAGLMAKEHNHDPSWESEQVNEYKKIAENYL